MTCRDSWNEVPKPIRIMLYTVLGIIAAFGFGLLFGWIIVWLWNALMPVIFGLPTITFWQGVGIFILAKLLFGGVSSGGSSRSDKKKRKNHWDSDKVRQKFEHWKHYDAWWESEGKAAFESFAGKADAEPYDSTPEDEKNHPQE